MIRIRKSNPAPDILTDKGVTATQKLSDQYDANPSVYHIKYSKRDNPHKLKIESKIYGTKEVKEKLIKDQYGKCCFCESKFEHTSFGDVEHYRPKGGYQQRGNDPLTYPGYYWLAYDWENLIFSCEVCNRRHKKNRFPLVTPANRATNHHADLTTEDPLLLHPVLDNPEDHIGFNKEVAFGKTNRGKESIRVYGIHRLNEQRLQLYKHIQSHKTLASLKLEEPQEKAMALQLTNLSEAELEDVVLTAREIIAQAAHDKAEYASMIRANYPDLPTN